MRTDTESNNEYIERLMVTFSDKISDDDLARLRGDDGLWEQGRARIWLYELDQISDFQLALYIGL